MHNTCSRHQTHTHAHNQEEILKLSLGPTEIEGKILEVENSEIKAEKYMSAAERLAAEKARKEEEARQKASALDDQISRALLVSCTTVLSLYIYILHIYVYIY